MKRYICPFLLFCFYISSNQVFAQDTSSPTFIAGTSNLDTSCDQVVPPDSAYGFVRVLERENSQLDFMQVNVEVEFQIADHEPCSMTKTTPIELHFPRGPFSIKMRRQEGQNEFQFSIHRKRLGPIMFLKDVDRVCLAYGEEWQNPIWC